MNQQEEKTQKKRAFFLSFQINHYNSKAKQIKLKITIFNTIIIIIGSSYKAESTVAADE